MPIGICESWLFHPCWLCVVFISLKNTHLQVLFRVGNTSKAGMCRCHKREHIQHDSFGIIRKSITHSPRHKNNFNYLVKSTLGTVVAIFKQWASFWNHHEDAGARWYARWLYCLPTAQNGTVLCGLNNRARYLEAGGAGKSCIYISMLFELKLILVSLYITGGNQNTKTSSRFIYKMIEEEKINIWQMIYPWRL